jgi:glycosyltransferase involved in cell wall biosynthesis
MARLIIADTTGRYDGRALETRPLGGTEATVILTARELARLGHDVTVHSNCEAEIVHAGVRWRPLSTPPDDTCDVFVAVQHPQLLDFVPHPKRRVIWVLWGANQLRHFKVFWRMWKHRPTPILMSQYQVSDYWPTLPRSGPLDVIPLPLPADVRALPPLSSPPPRRAIFASNPQRNLKALVEIWAGEILPKVPDAVLDVYGVHPLRPDQDAWAEWAGTLLPEGMPDAVKASVIVHPTQPREALLEAVRGARVMLYLGHKCEAFCLSLAEAQAMGTPAVVAPVAVLPERVVDGVTGFHRAEPAAFGAAAVRLLTDDALWRAQHEAALKLQQGITVAEYARRFEAAILRGLEQPRHAAAA